MVGVPFPYEFAPMGGFIIELGWMKFCTVLLSHFLYFNALWRLYDLVHFLTRPVPLSVNRIDCRIGRIGQV